MRRVRTAAAGLLIACSVLAGVSLSASAAPAEPPTYSGVGQMVLQTGTQLWCLGVKTVAYQGRGYPVVYSVACGAGGVWQTEWQLTISGAYPYYTGDLRPVAARDLCAESGEGNTTAALVPCNITLAITDISPRTAKTETWQLSLYGSLLSVTRSGQGKSYAEKIARWRTSNRSKYVQTFRFTCPSGNCLSEI